MKFTGPALKTKLAATGIHLAMSLVIFAILAYLIFYHWFPQPYFSIDGGWQGMRLIAFVDLVLGPFITFLIFDLSKRRREIVIDLAIILAIQFGALTYGVVTTYNQRPLAIVLIDENMISAVEEHYAGTLKSTDRLAEYSDEQPPIIYAPLPEDLALLREVVRRKNETGVQENAQIELYQPKGALVPALQDRQVVYLQRLGESGDLEALQAWFRQNEDLQGEKLMGIYQGRYGKAVLIFDESGRYLTYFRLADVGN